MSSEPELTFEQQIAAARILYENTRGMTMAALAEKTGIAKRTLSAASREQGWAKKWGQSEPQVAQTSQDVAKIAEHFDRKAEERANAPAPTEPNPVAETISEPLPSELNALLERHRREWLAPRAMSSEAVKIRDSDPVKAFERAKLAKITAETLKLVQDGERKAFGLDVGVDVPKGHVVVIERA